MHPFDPKLELPSRADGTRPIAGCRDRLDQLIHGRPVVVLDRRPLGEKMDVRALDTLDAAEGALDGLSARRAVHPFDPKLLSHVRPRWFYHSSR